PGRGDVERRVVDLHAFWGGLLPEAVRHLARIALLDGNGVAVGNAEIERARRGGNVERNVVGIGKDGDAVRADLVRGVAIGGNAVGPDDDGLHLSLFHDLGGHAVTDERGVDAVL